MSQRLEKLGVYHRAAGTFSEKRFQQGAQLRLNACPPIGNENTKRVYRGRHPSGIFLHKPH